MPLLRTCAFALYLVSLVVESVELLQFQSLAQPFPG